MSTKRERHKAAQILGAKGGKTGAGGKAWMQKLRENGKLAEFQRAASRARWHRVRAEQREK